MLNTSTEETAHYIGLPANEESRFCVLSNARVVDRMVLTVKERVGGELSDTELLEEQERFERATGKSSNAKKPSLFSQNLALKRSSKPNESSTILGDENSDISERGALATPSRGGFPAAPRLETLQNTDAADLSASFRSKLEINSSCVDYKNENNKILESMSAAEIEQAREELLGSLSSQTLETLRQRSTFEHERDNLEELNAPLDSAAQKHEDAKLEWTKPLDLKDALPSTAAKGTLRATAQLRFDLKGNLLSLEEMRQLPPSLGLHHHSDSAQLAGYTLGELLYLTRSTVPAQRTMALGALQHVLQRNLKSDVYTLFYKLNGFIFLVDGLGAQNLSVKLAALSALAAALSVSGEHVRSYVSALLPVQVTHAGFTSNIPMASFFTRRMELVRNSIDVRAFISDEESQKVSQQCSETDLLFELIIGCKLPEVLCKLLLELTQEFSDVVSIELVLLVLYRCALYDPSIAFTESCRSDLFTIIQRYLLPKLVWPNNLHARVIWSLLNFVETLLRMSDSAVAEQLINLDLLSDLMRFVCVEDSTQVWDSIIDAYWHFICQIWRVLVLKKVKDWATDFTSFHPLFQAHMHSLLQKHSLSNFDCTFVLFLRQMITEGWRDCLMSVWGETQVSAFCGSVQAFVDELQSSSRSGGKLRFHILKTDDRDAEALLCLEEALDRLELAEVKQPLLQNLVDPFSDIALLKDVAMAFSTLEAGLKDLRSATQLVLVRNLYSLNASWYRWYLGFPMLKILLQSNSALGAQLRAIGDFGVTGHEPLLLEFFKRDALKHLSCFSKYFTAESSQRFVVTDVGSLCSSHGDMMLNVGLPTMYRGSGWLLQFIRMVPTLLTTADKFCLLKWLSPVLSNELKETETISVLGLMFFELGRMIPLVKDDKDMRDLLQSDLKLLLMSALDAMPAICETLTSFYSYFVDQCTQLTSALDKDYEQLLVTWFIPFVLSVDYTILAEFRVQFWSAAEYWIPRAPLLKDVTLPFNYEQTSEKDRNCREAMMRFIHSNRNALEMYEGLLSFDRRCKERAGLSDQPFVTVFAVLQCLE